MYEVLSGRSVTHIADEILTKLARAVNTWRQVYLMIDTLLPQSELPPPALGCAACWRIEPTLYDPKELDPSVHRSWDNWLINLDLTGQLRSLFPGHAG